MARGRYRPGKCKVCGKRATRSVGLLCRRCRRVGDERGSTKKAKLFARGRTEPVPEWVEGRIEKYMARALKGLPLFEE